MAIVNRDLAPSQQRELCDWVSGGAIATGVTREMKVLAWPATLSGPVVVAATGVSNAMQVALQVKRFVAGAGETAIAIGISNIVLANSSLSGPISFTGLAAAGSTLLSLQAGDVLQVVTSVANGNATDLALNLVLQKTQDIVSYNGVSV